MDNDILIEIYIYLSCKGKGVVEDEFVLNAIHWNSQTVLNWVSSTARWEATTSSGFDCRSTVEWKDLNNHPTVLCIFAVYCSANYCDLYKNTCPNLSKQGNHCKIPFYDVFSSWKDVENMGYLLIDRLLTLLSKSQLCSAFHIIMTQHRVNAVTVGSKM